MLLIITPNQEGASKNVAQYASQLGWVVHEASPTGRIPDEIKKTPGTVYGSHMFCEIVASQMGWRLRQNKMSWITTLPYKYLSRNVFYSNVRFARSIMTPKYIQPTDYGLFTAGIYDCGHRLPVAVSIDNDPVLISDVMDFKSEYRTFIMNREVVAVCCTKYLGVPTTKYNWNAHNTTIVAFVNTMLKDNNIDCVPGTTIDIGMLEGGKMAVIGSAPAWKTKFHGCEPVAALDVLKDSCEVIN